MICVRSLGLSLQQRASESKGEKHTHTGKPIHTTEGKDAKGGKKTRRQHCCRVVHSECTRTERRGYPEFSSSHKHVPA